VTQHKAADLHHADCQHGDERPELRLRRWPLEDRAVDQHGAGDADLSDRREFSGDFVRRYVGCKEEKHTTSSKLMAISFLVG
jgi:hypothetical protein